MITEFLKTLKKDGGNKRKRDEDGSGSGKKQKEEEQPTEVKEQLMPLTHV